MGGLLVANVLVDGHEGPVDIATADGRIERIGRIDAGSRAAGEAVFDGEGAYAFAGFADPHIHLDKAHILDRTARPGATLAEAIRAVADAKAAFTPEDVFARASRVVESAILHGTVAMRSCVEVDDRAGMNAWEGLRRVRDAYAEHLDLELCVFAQDGTTGHPETIRLMREAIADGADLVGGCPYTDADPDGHVRAMFDLAEEAGLDIDFHVDFDLDPSWSRLPTILEETRRRGYEGRVTVGHVSKLSAMPAADRLAFAGRLADAGIGLTVLPATDLFLMGADRETLKPRGMVPRDAVGPLEVTVGTNNVVNPFTPFGNADLLRMANLYANVAQLALDDELRDVWRMVTELPRVARRTGRTGRLEAAAPADIVLIDASDAVQALRELRPVVAAFKRGVQTVDAPLPRIVR